MVLVIEQGQDGIFTAAFTGMAHTYPDGLEEGGQVIGGEILSCADKPVHGSGGIGIGVPDTGNGCAQKKALLFHPVTGAVQDGPDPDHVRGWISRRPYP